LASRAAEIARPLIESRRHELSISLPPDPIPLLADAARIDQVLVNLLNNAAKYTEPGGRIALDVERDGDEAVVRVRDNGIGIDPALLPHIFELFTQAERSLDRSQGGLGIGLTLARRLVELHGGSVTARSEGVGTGSEFTVRLPMSPSEAGAVETAPEPSHEGADPVHAPIRKVLVVDDNVDGAKVLARLLKASGHRVEVVHDGLHALEVARTSTPEVVLLDIGLPELDGYDVARRMRRLKGLEHVMLVALTGYGQEADRVRASAAGFDHHLVKPVDPATVCTLIAQHQAVG